MPTKLKYIIVIFLFGFFLFLPSLKNGFVWDDEEQIVNNTLIQSIKNAPLIFLGGAFNSGGARKLSGTYYKPLMTLSFSVIYSVFGQEPFFFHLSSLLLHLTNTILVFLIFSHFFKEKKSLLLSLLFLTHPLYSEVVFYAANTQDLLFFFFGVSALLLAIKKPYTNISNHVLVSLLLLFSLLSKETGIIFVLAVLFYRFWVSGFLATIIYSFLRFFVAQISFSPESAMSPISKLSLGKRLLNIPKMSFYYIQNLLAPLNLVPNQHWIISSISPTNFWGPFF